MNLDQFKTSISILVMVAVFIAALALTIDGFQDSVVEDLTTTSVSNESVVYTNNTAQSLANLATAKLTVSAVRDSNNTAVSSGNYTVNSDLGQITITNLGGWTVGHTTTVYVDYAYSEGDVQFNSTQEGVEGISNASSYLSTIGTLLGVAALISVVVGAFYFARR